MGLSGRARTFISRQRLEFIGDLVATDPQKFMALPSVGRRTVAELSAILARLGLSAGRDHPGWNRLVARSVAQQAARLADRLNHPAERAVHLADALVADLRLVEPSARNVEMIASQLGFDGTGAHTLEEVGAPHSLTRERVRQLVARACKRLREQHLAPEPLVRAISVASSLIPTTEALLTQALMDSGVEPSSFKFEGLLNAAEVWSIPFSFERVRWGDAEVILPKGSGAQVRRLATQAVRTSGSKGCVQLDNLAADVLEFDTAGGRAAIGAIVSQRDGFEWLDEQTGWFWYAPAPDSNRNRLVNTIKRVLAVASTISLGELRAAIRRNYRLGGFAPPTHVLRAICNRVPFAKIDGNNIIRFEKALDWQGCLSGTDLAFAKVFAEHGPVLQRNKLVQHCHNAGMNDASITVATTYSTVLWRPAFGYYALVGATIPPGTVEYHQRQKNNVSGQGTIDSGWLDDGSPYVCWRLTQSNINGGIFSIPAGIKGVLSGQFTMRDRIGTEIGNIRVTDGTCWNVTPLLRQSGAEPGEYVAIKFLILDKNCIGVVGGDEIAEAVDERRLADIFHRPPAQVESENHDEDDFNELE